jgi:hypothetical protein
MYCTRRDETPPSIIIRLPGIGWKAFFLFAGKWLIENVPIHIGSNDFSTDPSSKKSFFEKQMFF